MSRLKNNYLLLFLLLLAVSCNGLKKTNRSGDLFEVVKVIDGDTFRILNHQGEEEKVRLIGVDAPETRRTGRKEVGYYGKEATAFLKNLLADRPVRLEYDVQRKDRYGRTLAYVYLEDGTFVNDVLLKEGYAVVATFPPNVKYTDLFLKSEKNARKKKLGLWKKNSKQNK